jgi:hypothetical protein
MARLQARRDFDSDWTRSSRATCVPSGSFSSGTPTQQKRKYLAPYLDGSHATSEEYRQGRKLLGALVEFLRADEDVAGPDRPFSLMGTRFAGQTKDKSSLAERITAAFASTQIEDEAEEAAIRARDEAAAFVKREFPSAKPTVDVSEDGTLTLQWRGPDRGVMLVFIGDETVAYSVKNAGGTYGASVRELRITDALPDDVRAAIEQLDQ